MNLSFHPSTSKTTHRVAFVLCGLREGNRKRRLSKKEVGSVKYEIERLVGLEVAPVLWSDLMLKTWSQI